MLEIFRIYKLWTSQSAAVDIINSNASNLIPHANTFCASMKRRGGGVVAIHARIVKPRIAGPYGEKRRHQKPYVVVHLDVRMSSTVDVLRAVGLSVMIPT